MTKNKMIIGISKPRALRVFSFELSQNGKFEKLENIEIKKVSTRKFLCQSEKSKLSLTYNLN